MPFVETSRSVALLIVKPRMECNAAMTPAGIGGLIKASAHGVAQNLAHL